MDAPLPALFLSHGSPMLAVQDSPTGRFLDGLARHLPGPRAVLVASAHFNVPGPVVTAAERPATVHDFGGFPPALYALEYPAAGDPALAAAVAGRLRDAGFDARTDPEAGLDHGVWVPLRRMYPEADLPVLALSVDPWRDAAWHYRVGQALAPLRKAGVLVVGSGSFSHNLRALDGRPGAPVPDWVEAFTAALRRRLLEGDVAGALDWTALPAARLNHPTPEHLLPLFVALGAGGGAPAGLLHEDVELGALALDAYAFGLHA